MISLPSFRPDQGRTNLFRGTKIQASSTTGVVTLTLDSVERDALFGGDEEGADEGDDLLALPLSRVLGLTHLAAVGVAVSEPGKGDNILRTGPHPARPLRMLMEQLCHLSYSPQKDRCSSRELRLKRRACSYVIHM